VAVSLPQLGSSSAPFRLGNVLQQGELDQQLDCVMHEVRRDEQTVDYSETTGHVVPERQIEEVKWIFDPGSALGHRASCMQPACSIERRTTVANGHGRMDTAIAA
jgi:hypothetical protein